MSESSVAEDVQQSPSSPSTCPYQTPEEWQAFLNRVADNDKWIDTCEDAPCDQEYYAFVEENIASVFRACEGLIQREPAIEACTHNLRRFTRAWMKQHNSVDYGFNVDNHTYLTRQDAPDKPEGMMHVPDVIVNAMPSQEAVEEAARRNGLKFLTHNSALGNSRTFVIYSDPRGRFDQWLLLNLPSSKGGQAKILENTPLSILVVQKKEKSGRPLSRVRLHFRDYAIKHSGKGYRLELNEAGNGKCYSCHSNGVRQLIARRTPVLYAKPTRGEPDYDPTGTQPPPRDFAFRRLMEFNRRLRSYGAPDWQGMVIPEDHGPALGEAQGCIDCHDGKSRAALNVSTSHNQVAQKVFFELGMPYDTSLPRLLERVQMKEPGVTPDEAKQLKKAFGAHQALLIDFENSRLPTLTKWLLETKCRP